MTQRKVVMVGRIPHRNRRPDREWRCGYFEATLDFWPLAQGSVMPRYMLIAQGLLARDPVSPYAGASAATREEA